MKGWEERWGENRRALERSACYLLLWNPAMVDELLPMAQLGAAMALDKPMLIVTCEAWAETLPTALLELSRDTMVVPVWDATAADQAARWAADWMKRQP